MGAEFGLSYNEFLEAVINPSDKKFTKRYNGRQRPGAIRKDDAVLIKRYLDECVTNGLSQGSAKTSASYLASVARQCPGLQTMDTPSAQAALSHIRQNMKPNSARRAFGIFRGFIRWMHDEKVNTGIDMNKIQKVKSPKPDLTTKKASDMLSGEEITKLIEAAGNDRDRAMIAMMFEGSLRPVEVSAAIWGDLNFDKYGCQFTTSKKTGKPRYIRLIMAAPYLLAWKNRSPTPVSGDDPIFVSFKSPHQQLTRGGIYANFMFILKKSGIKKKVSPYCLRHSRITAMIRDEIPDSIVKKQAWGSLSSNMLATYAHLIDTDVDRVLLTRAGIITDAEKKDDSLKPRQCPICGKIHTPTSRFCDECGTSLTEEARQTVDSASKAIVGALDRNEKKSILSSMSKEELMGLLSEIAAGK